MKKAIFSLLVAIFLPLSAYAYEMGATELISNIGTETPLSETVGLRGSYTLFYVPKVDNTIHFLYLGPTFSISDFLWLSPQVGFGGNWVGGKDSFFASLWLGLSFLKGQITLFNEADIIFYDGALQDYYGFTSVNYHYTDFNFGIQFEQVNKNWKTGPHAGFKKGPMNIELQTYVIDNDFTNFNLRIVTGLSF
jgi:hypothetical protein